MSRRNAWRLTRDRQRHAEPLCPRCERRDDRLRAARSLRGSAAAGAPAQPSPGSRTGGFPGATGVVLHSSTRWRISRGQPFAAAERVGIDHLEEDRRGPRARMFRSSVTRERRRQGLDNQRERETLCDRARGRRAAASRRAVAGKHPGIVGRAAIRVDEPRSRQTFACAANRLFIAFVVVDALMSMRIGSPPVGNPAASGFGVIRDCTPPCGVTPAAAGSEHIKQHDEPGVGHRFEIRLEAADVVAPADDNRHDRMREDSRLVLRRSPVSRATDREAGGRPTSAPIRDRPPLPDRPTSPSPVPDLFEIPGQLIETVRVVAE